MKPKHELIRFVGSHGKVVIDTHMNVQSRGAYMCSTKECFHTLKKKRCLERHLKVDASDAYEYLSKKFEEE
jgi:predicted RNA-binding protein YlxR (DUF448 family)